MKTWLLVCLSAVFAAGLSAGFFAARRLGPVKAGREAPPFFINRDFYSLVTRDEFYRELELNEQQRAMVAHLLASHRKRVGEIQESLGELAEDLRTGILAALSPDQVQRFDGLQRKILEVELQANVSREVSELRGSLPLTPEEETRVHPILLDYGRKKSEVWRTCATADREARLSGLRTERDQQLGQVLSAEKLFKYQERRGKRRGGGDRGFQRPHEGGKEDARSLPMPPGPLPQ